MCRSHIIHPQGTIQASPTPLGSLEPYRLLATAGPGPVLWCYLVGRRFSVKRCSFYDPIGSLARLQESVAMSTSSSSSEDEDLSKFASCAVSADQIEKDAQVEAKKRVIRASQRPISSAARPAAASTQQQQQDGGSDEPASTGLDLVSVKVCPHSCRNNLLLLTYF